ncbi:hypothetical protein Zm00014a_003135 [Zea mays]|uniref:Ubiquitin-like protease family profile domain-containing protein n=1 Tax=Zea mays TaxID=4577 RepID=A0A317YFA0_MAIZE|nr:hypothetical protein Zm00014a_003135 [Zea mays]
MVPKRTHDPRSGDESTADESSLEASNFEKNTKPGKTGLGSHCEPTPVVNAAKLLSPEARQYVIDCGFGAFLEMKATKIFSLETIIVILNKCDVSSSDESFTIVLSDEHQLKVTTEVVHSIFGLPTGEISIDQKNFTHTEFLKFWKILKAGGHVTESTTRCRGKPVSTKRITLQSLLNYMEAEADKEKQAFAFFTILLSKLLLTTTSNVPTKGHVALCSYIENTQKIVVPEPKLEEASAGPLIKHYDDNRILELLKAVKDTIKFKEEIANLKVQRNAKPQPPKEKKPASKRQKGEGQNLGIQIHVEDLLKGYEVDENQRGILLKVIEDEVGSSEIKLMEKLKKIVANRSFFIFYDEIKNRAQIKDKERIQQMEKNLVVDIEDVTISEAVFVKTFKPYGRLHTSIIETLIRIWNKSWDDRIMLSLLAVEQILGKRKDYLERELKDYDKEKKHTIFVPFIIDQHWSLVVVEPGREVITVLDSFYELRLCEKRHENLMAQLQKNLYPFIGLENATHRFITPPVVQNQNNSHDCGFHMLLYIKRYEDQNYHNISEDEVIMCRIETAMLLLNNEDNKCRDKFTESHAITKEQKKEKVRDKVDDKKGDRKDESSDDDYEDNVQFMSPKSDTARRDTDTWNLTGSDIAKSFVDKTLCEDTVATFYVQCLMYDEGQLGADEKTVFSRIFLEPKVAELLLSKEYKLEVVADYMKGQYNAQQICKAMQIFVPICQENHWTLYVVNKKYGQIDILDSSPTAVNDKMKYHQSIAAKVRQRLNAVLLRISKEEHIDFIDFSKWGLPLIPKIRIAHQDRNSMDCGFFVMFFMRHYNPDTHLLEGHKLADDQVEGDQLEATKDIRSPNQPREKGKILEDHSLESKGLQDKDAMTRGLKKELDLNKYKYILKYEDKFNYIFPACHYQKSIPMRAFINNTGSSGDLSVTSIRKRSIDETFCRLFFGRRAQTLISLSQQKITRP